MVWVRSCWSQRGDRKYDTLTGQRRLRARHRARGGRRRAGVERIAELRVIRHASVVHLDERPGIPDFHVVRAGDVGHGRTPARVQGVVVVEAEVERIEDAAIREVRTPVDAGLFRHRNQVHQPVRRRHAEPRVSVGKPRVARFDQRAAADWCGIRGLRRVVREVVVARECLRRHRIGPERSSRRDPVAARLTAAFTVFSQRRSTTPTLIVVRERHTVARRELARSDEPR